MRPLEVNEKSFLVIRNTPAPEANGAWPSSTQTRVAPRIPPVDVAAVGDLHGAVRAGPRCVHGRAKRRRHSSRRSSNGVAVVCGAGERVAVAECHCVRRQAGRSASVFEFRNLVVAESLARREVV